MLRLFILFVLLSLFGNVAIFELFLVEVESRGSWLSIIIDDFNCGFILIFGDLTTFFDNDGLDGPVLCFRRLSLNDIQHVPTLRDFSKDDMLVVEMWGRLEAQEELRAVGARAGISHGKATAARMLILKVLVFELASVDGLAAGSVAISKITSLSHEARNDAMEGTPFKV